jgi:hypothetical protein
MTMAMQTCKECGHEVSSQAASCPTCGALIKKKTRAVLWGCLTLIAVVIWVPIIVLEVILPRMGSLTSDPQGVDYFVTYVVDGTVREAGVTYQNDQGGSQQETVQIPWQKSFRMARGSFLYISARNQGSFGCISVRITINGTEFKRSDGKGGYTIASASGSCCT